MGYTKDLLDAPVVLTQSQRAAIPLFALAKFHIARECIFLIYFKLAWIKLFLYTIGFEIANPEIYFALKGQKNKLYTIIDKLKKQLQVNGVFDAEVNLEKNELI